MRSILTHRQIFFIILMITSIIILLNIKEIKFQKVKYEVDFENYVLLKEIVQYQEEFEKGTILGERVKTEGCVMPDLKVWGDPIKRFIFEEKKITCDHVKPALVYSNSNSLFLKKSSLKSYGINNTDLLKCCYQPFRRADPLHDKDQKVVFDLVCYEFSENTNVENVEFVRVSCKNNGSEIYKDFFDFVPLKNSSVARNEGDDSLNVLILGIDGVSRLNFHRQMPTTQGLLEVLKSVDMMGFNKIGDNSFPNQIPVLTGLTVDELKDACWPTRDDYFDDCPIIWKAFKEAGFTTAFGEDAAWMGLFVYHAVGFKKQPTDYYWDHFNFIADKEIGSAHKGNVNECIGAKPAYKLIIDYTSKFAKAMNLGKRKYFSYFWGSVLSHDYLNKPKLGDADYHNLISELNKTGVLNNTALILMSDHGIRFGSIRVTFQGLIEERLPFLHILLPRWYTDKHALLYKNLRINRNRLITSLDLHETIKDLINSSKLTNELLQKRADTNNKSPKRSYSLFDKITPKRTCKDAGITSHWCACQISKKIDPSSTIIQKAATFIVDAHLNNILSNLSECAVLKLHKVLEARVKMSSIHIEKNDNVVEYTIVFQTQPGGGLFEGTVKKIMTYGIFYSFQMDGFVSRINLYGNQSNCVSNVLYKLYCYCK